MQTLITHVYVIVPIILEGTDLPVVIETTQDPTINNLTRNDINCDKTGTCYDGIELIF